MINRSFLAFVVVICFSSWIIWNWNMERVSFEPKWIVTEPDANGGHCIANTEYLVTLRDGSSVAFSGSFKVRLPNSDRELQKLPTGLLTREEMVRWVKWQVSIVADICEAGRYVTADEFDTRAGKAKFLRMFAIGLAEYEPFKLLSFTVKDPQIDSVTYLKRKDTWLIDWVPGSYP